MNLVKFLQKLVIKDWKFFNENNQLHYSVAQEEFTYSVLTQLKQYKAEILELLQEQPDIFDVYPLSYGQRALWFLWQLAPESYAYNTSLPLHIFSAVNVEIIEKALRLLIIRHSILRTTFIKQGMEPIQQVHQNQKLDFLQIDASTWSENVLKARVIEAHQVLFDLEEGPLMRVRLFSYSGAEHVLLLTMPHIICDRWSLGIMLQELLQLYQTLENSTEIDSPPIKYFYQDYVSWQKKTLTETQGEKLWDYWKKQLAGNLPILNLTTDRQRPRVQTYNGAAHKFKLSPKLTNQVKELAQSSGVTLYMILLAAFQVLLYRYTGQKDILVGSPTLGRNQPEFISIVGYFVNQVVIRANLSNNPSFKDFLFKVRQIVLEALAHQDYPFPLLAENLQVDRDPSYSGVFQASFSLQQFRQSQNAFFLLDNKAEKGTNQGEIQLRIFDIPQQEGQFDLALEMIEDSLSTPGIFKYNTDLFDGSTIERIANHFQNLLSAIVTNPQQTVSEMSLLTVFERQQLLYDFNDTTTEFPAELCVHQLFEQQVQMTPDSIAIVYEQQQLTYGQLNQRANQLAHYLQSYGVGPDTIVGLCAERSIEMVVGLLGILKAGGAYLPLDPNYPQERLAFMLDDARASLVLSERSVISVLSGISTRVLLLDELQPIFAILSKQQPICTTKSNHLAYVIYTSGSTGIPKGVPIEHRSITRLVKNTSYINFSPHQVFLQLAPITFDAATFELWGALLNGARLAIASSKRLSLEETAQQLQRQQVSTLWLTAGFFQVITEHHLEAFASVRQLITGGDILPIYGVQRVLHKYAHLQLVNGYGPTEGTTFSCTYTIPTDWVAETSVPIGRPIANTQVYVLDEQRQPVPIGVAGELFIGGAGVARGYLNRPELTAEKFIADPFSNKPNARLHRTGDLCRWRADGNLEFLGRIDHQVKLRGFRIELGEIESVLGDHPAVVQAVVIIDGQSADNKQLVAYIVLGESDTISLESLREYLKSKLPEYMVPALFVMLEAFPLTVNGKIDRKTLLAMEGLELSTTVEYVPPQTPAEKILAQLWSEVLNREQIGIYNNFFELGGHSLLATRLISRLREVFEVELPLRALFEQPTIAGLARTLQHGKQSSTPIIAIERGKQSLPLSFAQQRLWFLAQLEGPSATYNIPIVLRLTGALNVAALEYCLNRIAQRHEVLRTHFALDGENAVQIVTPHLKIPFPIIGMQELSEPIGQIELQRLLTEEAQRAFDLSTGPLLRAFLFRLATEEHVLLLNMHHIVSDGWSMGILVKEVIDLYQAYINNLSVTLPELPIQYADFASWHRQWLQGEVLQAQMDYWIGELEGAPPLLKLPTDHSRPAVQSFRGRQLSFCIPKKLTQRLHELSRQQSVTLFMTLLGAYAVLLNRYSGQSDLVIGSPIANRTRKETENLIGFFVNTLALRIDLSCKPTFEQLLEHIRQVALGAYEHQDLPFEKLVEELQPQRSLSHTPLFQVTFILQNAPMEALELQDLQIESFENEMTISRFDLTLCLEETASGMVGTWQYNSDLFEPETIARLNTHFQVLLEGIVREPEQQIQALPLLTAVERQQLLYDFNDTATEFPTELCVHQLFEQQVEKTPDAIAVVFERQQMSYRQLNQRANQLAHYLQSLGVGPDTIVGLCIERSIEMVIGLLGILKAGGAYLPLDPNYPPERLAFMLDDAQSAFLLTQKSLADDLPSSWVQLFFIEDWPELFSTLPTHAPNCAANSSHLAYVIYTSGSTGKPKGVMVEHQSICNHMLWIEKALKLASTDRILQKTPFSFDASVWEFYAPLIVGGQLVMAQLNGDRDASYLIQTVKQEKVTILQIVPFLLRVLLEQEGLENCCSLRHVVCGGEQLSQDLQQKFSTQVPFRLYNFYGPTEACIDAAWWTCQEIEDNFVPIGVPIANVQIYILDSNLRLMPIGVEGELFIGGAGVARGYLNRPELTAEKFIADPFSNKPNARLYRTGDIGRWRTNGQLEYIGRVDSQVKLRGFRIELGEIEAVLCEHPTVQQTIAIVKGEQAHSKQLIAYVIPAESEAILLDSLREYSHTKLPEYMVPTLFVVLESFPLTVNGKIDRKALSMMEGFVGQYVPPQTPIEELLAQLWSEILHQEQISIYDNFFDLGGHSLLATQLISRIRNVFGLELPLRAIFEKPTITLLAKALLSQGVQAAPPIVPVARDEYLPLSFAQQRLWFLAQLEGASATYNVPIALQITGQLDVAALEYCLRKIVERHEVLRTHFAVVDEEAVQIITPQLKIPFPVIDLQTLSETSQQIELQKLITREAQQPFDLSTAPMLRMKLVHMTTKSFVLLLTMHHIISDDWSMIVFVKEVMVFYQAYITNTPAALPELPIQYADFSHWQRHWLQGEFLQSQLDYWIGQLKGAPPLLELPRNNPRPTIQSFRGSQLSISIPVLLTQRLKELSRQQGSTLFMTLLGVYAILISRYSGQRDIVIGSPIANRNRSDTENLIGFFVNMLPLRINLNDELTFEHLLEQVRQVTLGAYAHQDLPFEKLVEKLQPERSLSYTPIFQVVFVLQKNAPMETLQLDNLELNLLENTTTTTKFDLALKLTETEDSLTGLWEYNSELFKEETIELLNENLLVLIESITSTY